mmetsp:Transcript_44679/g.140702  ORF Transcript_44679/g.140702 Transcript_44679/m.140702 type:complete len:211 (+) Transcript_44679:106-738(+)
MVPLGYLSSAQSPRDSPPHSTVVMIIVVLPRRPSCCYAPLCLDPSKARRSPSRGGAELGVRQLRERHAIGRCRTRVVRGGRPRIATQRGVSCAAGGPVRARVRGRDAAARDPVGAHAAAAARLPRRRQCDAGGVASPLRRGRAEWHGGGGPARVGRGRGGGSSGRWPPQIAAGAGRRRGRGATSRVGVSGTTACRGHLWLPVQPVVRGAA